MNITITVTPTKTWVDTETVTAAKLNQTAQPTVAATLTGLVTDDLTAEIVTPPKISRNAPFIIAAARNLLIKTTVGFSNRVDITADEVCLKDANGVGFIVKNVNLNPDIAASGVANGLDTGGEAANTWYFIWVIYNETTATVAGLFSLSSTSPTMPSGYTYKALAGAVRNDNLSNFAPMYQRDRRVFTRLQTLFTAKTVQAGTAVNTYENMSTATVLTTFQGFVPSIAKAFSGLFGRDDVAAGPVNAAAQISGDGNGLGSFISVGPYMTTKQILFSQGAEFMDLPILNWASDGFFWRVSEKASSRWALFVNGYVI